MPRYLKINIICILFIVFSVPASSELYQYKDGNGITRLTDNIYSVPIKQRSQLEHFSEFEGLSDELKILPIQNKSLPQTKNQTKTEKVIYPKTSKTISATTEKNAIVPDIPLDAKKETTSPFQPIISGKPVQATDTKLPPREAYKSKKITINKKITSLKKTAKVLSTKNLKEKTELRTPPKTAIMPETVSPKPKKDIKKSVTADTKIAAPQKIVRAEPKKAIKKNVMPDNKKPGTKEKTLTKTQKKSQPPEKTDKIKPVQKADSSTVAKKEIKAKVIIADKKTVTSQEIPKILPKKNVKPDIQPNKPKKTAPSKKMPADKKTEPKKNIKKSVQPDAGEKTIPETKIVKKEPTKKIAKKTVSKTETKKPTPSKNTASSTKTTARQKTITATNTTQIKPEVDPQKIIENVTKEFNEKDESLILAQLQTTRKFLAEKKEALNKKFLSLMKKKQGLENSVDEDDEKSVLIYNENVKKLNIKIKQYKKEKKRLQAKIEEYNNMIKQSTLN